MNNNFFLGLLCCKLIAPKKSKGEKKQTNFVDTAITWKVEAFFINMDFKNVTEPKKIFK